MMMNFNFFTIIAIVGIISHPSTLDKCIKSMLGVSCKTDQDCYVAKEFHLYCNETKNARVCSFNDKALIGHSFQNWDCPGDKFSAIAWGNPVSLDLAANGLDCMRLCLYTDNCFGISIRQNLCYLKNDLCFEKENLVHSPNTMIGVVKVVREDYRCGCHYPFFRRRHNDTITKWYSYCPASQVKPKLNPYGCCSEEGLCIPCK